MSAAAFDRVTFVGADGQSHLAARLDRPVGPPRAFAIFAHCFTCTKESLAAARIADGLTRHGVAVLRFDFTGLGGSEGEFANTGFSSNIDDLVAAADWLRATHAAPSILVGHSLGGSAALAGASRIPEVKAVATIGAPADLAPVRRRLSQASAEIEAKGSAEVEIAGRHFTISQAFLDDLQEHRLEEDIARMRTALLVCHSPRDEIVSIDNATRIFVAAKHPKSFISLDDADHLLTRRADAHYVADVISAWAERYLDLSEPHESHESREPHEPHLRPAPAGAVRVIETGVGRYTQWISYEGRHVGYADEPEKFGGNDSGPGPYDLLLAGLGACTSMTLRMYAERQKWPLERVTVTLRHTKIHAQDCANCATQQGQIDRIEREIEVEGALDAAMRTRLLEIADRCPVHRTLQSEVLIETRLHA
ncbi:MAG: OsmC family protein [Candidatus Competibacteraceae bacterium]|nr:OsmC family protein [Candidatus Competibacteraceae bacterium]